MSDYTQGIIYYDADDPDDFDREIWIRKHPALLKAEADVDCATVTLHAVYDLLDEEWDLVRGYPDEGKRRTSAEVVAEQEKKGLAEAESDLIVATLHDELKEAIAKYGVKVPVKVVATTPKPAETQPPTAPPAALDMLKALAKDAPKDKDGNIDWSAVVGELLGAAKQ